MSKISRRLLSLLLCLCLTFTLASGAAAATSPSPVDPSDELSVYVRANGKDTLLHTYSLSEMRRLASGDNVYYSGIDQMPCPVEAVASGVYLEDLLDDAQEYTNYDLSDYQYIRTRSTDNATGKFTYDDLFGDRYYFPELHEEGTWDPEEQEADMDSLGSGTYVEPMLAISCHQTRKPSPGSASDNRDYDTERYTLLFGITYDEVESCESRVSEFRRGVSELIFDLGAVDEPIVNDPVSITLSRTSLSLEVGGQSRLRAEVTPDEAASEGVTWSSNDSSIAEVDSDGLVTGIKEGFAVITARSVSDTSCTKTCVVTVTASRSEVTSIEISEDELTLTPGAKHQLTARIRPTGAEAEIIWESDDTGVAKVSSNGYVTAVSEGTAEITAQTDDGRFTATCTVTVDSELISVTGVRLSESEITVARGEKYSLSATVLPRNANNRNVVWSSSNPGVVSVDTDGTVTARNTGTCTVTVTTRDGSFTDKCTVTVVSSTSAFSDISGHWAESSITAMADAGYVNGKDDGKFHPNDTITRAEFVAILMRILSDKTGQETIRGQSFDDTANHWASDYISTAVSLKIVGGYGGNRFGPNDPITREQIAVIMTNAVNGSGDGLALSFTDSASISSWARAGVGYAKTMGWITGYSDGSFRPGSAASRAEVCTMLLRLSNGL